MIFDPTGVQREYVDAQSGWEERLVNYSIPSARDSIIVVHNLNNKRTDYKLKVEATGTSE